MIIIIIIVIIIIIIIIIIVSLDISICISYYHHLLPTDNVQQASLHVPVALGAVY